MANVMITIDDGTLRRARIRAIELGTSIDVLLRDYLQALAGSDRMVTRHVVLRTAEDHAERFGFENRTWTRDDLHERA